MSGTDATRPQYRADLDGLRGVAVILVILFHTGFGISGGYIGVDVFFVLSGYLITGIVAADIRQKRFSLADFWVRRTRRLAPPALVVFGISLLVGYFILLPRDYSSMANVLQSQLTVTSNVYLLKHLNYFDGPAEMQPLLHTWSLSVEEQFYIAFPLLLMLTMRRSPRWSMALICGLGAISFLTNLQLSSTHTQAAFFLLPSRAWEMILGGVVALSPSVGRIPARWLSLSKLVALSGILIAAYVFDQNTLFPGVAVLVPVLGTALLVIPAASDACVVSRLLSHSVLVATGKASYSLYLWHWPILVLLKHFHGHELPFGIVVVAVGATVVLSIASYLLIEQPVRQKRVFATSSRLMLAMGLGWAALMLGTQFLRVTKGYPERLPASVVAKFQESRVPLKYGSDSMQRAADGQWPSLGTASGPADNIDFILWGDSHAMAAAQALDDLGREYGLRGRIAARNTTIPLDGVYRVRRDNDAVAWNQHILRFIREKKIKHVFLAAKWVSYVDGRDHGRLDTLVRDADSSEVSRSESTEVVRRGLKRTLSQLEDLGAHVWILKQVPYQDRDRCHDYLAAEMFRRMVDSNGVTLSEHRQFSRRIDGIFEHLPTHNVRFLDPEESCFDDSGRSLIGNVDVSYYADQDHLSPLGARVLIRPLVEPAFTEISAARNTTSPQRLASRRD